MSEPALRVVRCLLLVGSSLGLLAGCGKSLSELLNESQVYSASATPNPVPAAAETRDTRFTVNTRVDSNGSADSADL